MRFRQLCDVKEAIGVRKGNTFNWDIFTNIVTGATVAGIGEDTAMPTSSFTIGVGTCTIGEFGNSIPLTRKLKDMSEYDVKSIIRQTLVNDMAKTVDKHIWTKFAASLLVAQASGAGGTDTANIALMTDGSGDSANAATSGLQTGHVLHIVDTMKELNIPTFDGDSYLCVSHPTTLKNIRASMLSTGYYTESGRANVMSGEIGSFGGVRFIEQTNVAKVTATTPGAGNGWALFVGGEAMIEAVAVPEELIEKEVTDYGRSLGLAWYANLGFQLPYKLYTDQRSLMWWPNATLPTSLTP
jgi:N4-gp56 family major capsid protein